MWKKNWALHEVILASKPWAIIYSYCTTNFRQHNRRISVSREVGKKLARVFGLFLLSRHSAAFFARRAREDEFMNA